jgi:Ca-activated chloride channel family protein
MSTYGRNSTVRSHRRGGARRRINLAPWLIGAGAIALVAAGAAAGYTYFVKDGCSGQTQASVVVTPKLEAIMKTLAGSWAETAPSVGGTCGSVSITAKDSSEVVTSLAGDWDTKTEGPAPDVWVPDSSAWVRKASVDADAERIMPDLQPSLARTPTVIAMPKELADAAGMTAGPVTWQQIIDKLQAPDGWKAYNHPEWGPFKVALSDPQDSTAGLLALMAISDTDDSGDVSADEQQTLLNLKKVISLKASSTNEIFDGLRNAAGQGQAAALTYVSAFPALEQDVVTYNKARPTVPLVAVYPKDGTAEADFPYLVLNNTPWADAKHQEVAQAFLRYVRGSVGKAAFQEAGFRDGNRAPGPDLTAANGVTGKITALPRAILLPESVQHAAASWTAVTRPTNVLFVFDTSGSMAGEVPGAGKSRLDLTKAAALSALDLLDGTAQIGVWSFSTAAAGKDYKQLLSLAPLNSKEKDATHREAVTSTISGLKAGGNTGLYNTAWAACQEVSAKYVQGAANLVVLLTDGADDNNVSGGLTLPQLLTNLQNTCADQAKPVQLITIGLGVDSDSDILRQISAATKTSSFSSPTAFDISQVMLTALFH